MKINNNVIWRQRKYFQCENKGRNHKENVINLIIKRTTSKENHQKES